jgi:hypothetical protein
LRVLFLLGFLVGVPLVAPAAGHFTHVAGVRQVRQESSWRQVSAVLLQSAPPTYYGYRSVATYWVAGRWRAPSGATRSGMIPTTTGARKGDKVSIWVDPSGRQMAGRPMTLSIVQVRTVMAEVGSAVGLGLALLVLAGLIRLLLNRRRLAHWGIEWACFGPRWSTRRWPGS